MRTGLNALDSPEVDVLVLVPVSPTAERDMRIMRQAVEMWEGGVDYLAPQMGLGWLADGVDFHITVDSFDPVSGQGGEFTTYPVVDPEIVVIASNPVGGIGIGIDPVNAIFVNENLVPCMPVPNPFVFDQWKNLPGFDGHHEQRTGTYNEDCGGAGGNVCFAVNGAIDPAPGAIDFFGLFDLVSHEFGHCLTVGHVGDGAEGKWGKVPTNDIMAYHSDPPGLTKCVSTLDVESFALRMSGYLDVNGDGRISSADRLVANDPVGQGGNPFQVQHPSDHLYASSTGSPLACPQPDLGLVPGARTDWTPTPVSTNTSSRTVTSPSDSTSTADPQPTTDSQPTPTSEPTSEPTTQPASEPPSEPTSDQTTSGPAAEPASEPADRPTAGTPPPGLPEPSEPVDPDQVRLSRVKGSDRVDTAISASLAAFDDKTADTAVISRSDNFPDGLAGTSLAVTYGGPMLLNPPGGMDARVDQELRRVLSAGSTVFVLGGPTALNSSIDTHLRDMGYDVERIAGRDRFETAALVARAQPAPKTILVATGQNYPDALAAGAAAAQSGGTVLLSDNGSMPPVSAAYLSDFRVPVVAIGGPAAAAVPGAEAIVGSDRFATSVAVARRFFARPAIVAIGSGASFPDSLSGGALVGRFSGPMLLSAPDRLSPVVTDYLNTHQPTIKDVLVLGGESAVSRSVADEALAALRD